MGKRARLVLERVKTLLENNPELRDDDRQLMIRIWAEDLNSPALALPKGTPFRHTFTMKYPDGGYVLTSPESIRRSRQSIQEHHPELRGKADIVREEEQEEWKEELGYAAQPVLFDVEPKKGSIHDIDP